MDSCDVLIVGGGPAGSSCAWKLRQSGLDTLVLDKQVFPRDKVCAGWITPAVLQELEIAPDEYARGRVLQAIHGFRTGMMGGREVETDYGRPISYGIRRCEFDEYLLKRSGARILEGVPLAALERSADHWIANGRIRARILVGAGGHFCPVARHLGANARPGACIAAQETEFEMTAVQRAYCTIRPEIPELYFCRDMKGYGWCVRKDNFLNVGLGRLDPQGLPGHVAGFLRFLKATAKVCFDLPSALKGHSYLLSGFSTRDPAGDGVLLIGDSAGIAYPQSGEGIRPAVESGLLAAKAILDRGSCCGRRLAETYRNLLDQRLGASPKDWAFTLGKHVPAWLTRPVAQLLLANGWFAKNFVLDRWFLHSQDPALTY